MTKKIRNTIQWLLVAVMSVAVVFGAVSFASSERARAADTAVTFSAAALGDESHDTYGTSIRFDTAGLQWETYHNWVVASDWTSIADYTTVNGRTVTEINNATTHTQKITLMMQPAGSFSFLRLYIPAEIIPLGEVKSMGILDGWSFNNGTSNYTTSAVTFLRNGDTMVESSSFSAVTKLSASDITIGEAQLVNPSNEAWGTDSYTVSIDIGQEITSEYNTMYDGYKTIRNAIYINGKSIEEWNSQKIAEDSRFNNPATYTRFPQNSTDSSHLAPFVKPVGLWATSTGFRLSIFQELVADCETVTVSVGAGCTLAGTFMVAETTTKTVLTQNVVDITSDLSFQDFGTTAGTEMYRIKTGSAAWTKSPLGGCLNEYDPSAAGGGQIQMKYLYLGESDFWSINKNDDGAYGSTQGNIASGGVYAPILVEMGQTEGYSYVQIRLPSAYPDTNASADVNHASFTIKKGFNVKEGDTSYYVSNDVRFKNDGAGNWTKEIVGKEIATEVTGIITKANRTDGGNNENFVIFQLSENDYAGCNTTAITDISSLFGYIDIGGTVIESYSGEKFFNVWNISNSVAFRFADVTTLQNVPYITIKAGAKFPSVATQSGGQLTYYVTSEDVTFVHDVPNDTWTVGSEPAASYTVTFTVDGATYHTETVKDGETVSQPADPTKAEDDAYTYEFKYWTLNGAEYDFNATITGNITLVAEFDATKKERTVDITGEITFHHQSQQFAGTETYLIKTESIYWTKAPEGGCLNEYDPEGLGGGQEQMKYLYLNGVSLYDINKSDNDSYGSSQKNIAGGGIYAPILVTMGKVDSENYSYIQIHVPTAYPNTDATADLNHRSIEMKKGFSVTEGAVTCTVTEDLKWVNLNGTWVKESQTFDASNVTIGNPRVDGVAKELYKVDITSASWNITCNDYDFMYGGAYENYRKFIFINGVSVYDINANTDDSGYVYSSSPMTGNNDDLFAHPVLIQTHYQGDNSDPHTITLWMHKNYIESLGEEIIITLGAGYSAFTGDMYLEENVDYDMVAAVDVYDGTFTTTNLIVKGSTLPVPATPTKEMTQTTGYEFDNWYIANTDTVYDFNTPVTEGFTIEARFNEFSVLIKGTEISQVVYNLAGENDGDRWLIFYLTEHDYPVDVALYGIIDRVEYLKEIGLLDKIVLKGTINVGGQAKTEATLNEIFTANGFSDQIYLNIWDTTSYHGTIAFRTPGVSIIDEIVVEEGCMFPSYEYLLNGGEESRYMINKIHTCVRNKAEQGSGPNVFVPEAAGIKLDFSMQDGAAVRIGDYSGEAEFKIEGGIRFKSQILKSDVEVLKEMIESGTYEKVSFGTLIVPTDYIMGGQFTHEWLKANGKDMLDIPSTANLEEGFALSDDSYYFFCASIINLKEANYARAFSARGYVLLVDKDGKETYVYTKYTDQNSRSAKYVAQAAKFDRKDVKSDEYDNLTSDNDYSPYDEKQHGWLAIYIGEEEDVALGDSVILKKGESYTRVVEKKLAGPYVELSYSTTIDLWGVFEYTDGTKTAKEDFYLQQGTTTHRQYLDIFRYNGVGYGMDTGNLTMVSITFTNAELDANSSGEVKILTLYSFENTIDTANQEIYVTVKQSDGSEMTVGAHLGIGGALTYLAKSGVYEGVIGGSGGWKNGTVAISTDPSVFDSTNRYKSGSSSSSYSTEAGYYGHANSSKAADGAVNLINNFDAGRQIQQSWYAQVGGSDSATDGSNGYNRAYCYTGSSAGQYWPYNPVQAGDVVSNPSQIIDYEVNEAKGYIYVKARAMDWAKGYDSSRPCENAVEGGVTTKSYVENYYRLNADGTLVVNNRFIDWNGFTDMETCGWASTELPAVYPIQSLNYYVSNTNGDGTWEDDLEYNSSLTAWTGGTAYHQFANAANGDTKVEDWFAWANGGDGSSFGMGMYIPNVNRYTSGRSNTSTAYYTDVNFQNSNALPVSNYTEFSWSSLKNVDMVSSFAERGNILADKGMMSNMQEIKYTYQGAYVSNTSYTAPGVDFRMEAFVPIEYSYVICLDSITNIRNRFKEIKENGTVTNAGNPYEKVGLDAWARADKKWTW